MHASAAHNSNPARSWLHSPAFWKIIAGVCAGLLLLWIFLFFSGALGRPGLLWPSTAETSAASQTATEFLTRYLTFSAAQVSSQRTELQALMTPEFQQAFQLVWQDPKLVRALQKREVQVAVISNLPVFKARDSQGNYYFAVSGRVTISSPLTVIHAVEHAFSGTLLLVKTGPVFKVANAVWDNRR
jgi:hypothetical protein